ncbi:YeeE/YedE family protein [Enterovirga rhinocerotis]|uniref:Uncharacterized protein n=1 Tax=Enterovirga rhinocerotis TaxID=1339210 RepID=A0A4R7C4L8_9HYPH|nr:YeeE/YedE family protein [Enterovirga rhinocerotis]TDR93111.1 hypothetical protein EV668_0365 [Enterovirga rhinocerotis]
MAASLAEPDLGAGSSQSPLLRAAIAALIAFGLLAGVWALSAGPGGSKLALSLAFGGLFGFALQRSRFCFACHWRDLLDKRDPRGVLAIILSLAVGIAGTTVVIGAWLPDPSGTRLPPDAHIGPVSWVLVAAGLAFGAGMAISGSCISAHLYRLGEGSPTAPFALLGTAIGFAVGFWSWNPLYLATLSDAPVVWLPRHLGYGGALLLGLAILAGLALLLLARRPTDVARPPVPAPDPLRAVFVERWPAWTGGLAIGALATMAYLRIGPLGVTAEIGSRTRQAAAALELLPQRLEGLDTFRGCATAVRDALLTPNGLFVAGLVLASLAGALAAGQFRPELPRAGHVVRGIVGGVLLGWGAMVGLGCSIGTLLSGISAGALSGWVFAVAMFAGASVTTALGRRARLLPGP